MVFLWCSYSFPKVSHGFLLIWPYGFLESPVASLWFRIVPMVILRFPMVVLFPSLGSGPDWLPRDRNLL